jgi:hypothetical protein
MPRVRRLAFYILLVCFASRSLPAGSLEDRHIAIERALSFLYTTASTESNVAQYGSDMLWCFYTISHTSRNPQLAAEAARMGRDLAIRWRKSHQHVPADATPHEIYLLVAGAYSADLLDVRDRQLKAELVKAAPRFTARDYLGFDARREPPHPDDPRRYDTWSGALIITYFGDAYGVRLGARYHDVVKWMSRMRPFDGHDEDTEFDAFYAITHVIYTLDRYHENSVKASLLPEEFRFLRRKLDEAIDDEDPEMVGEAIDCLKAAGLESDPQVQKGMDYLVSTQRADGAWAGEDGDTYTAYHSAWTGIDGLRDYHYRNQVRSLPGP